MRRFAQLALSALLVSACGGPSIPDGGIACSSAGVCPARSDCLCPASYQACVDGVCATTCPASGLGGGAGCVYDCQCDSFECALDSKTCCASAGHVGSNGACSNDCDCQGKQCSGGTCT